MIYVHKNDLKKFVRFNYLSKNIKDELSGKITTQEEKDADTKKNKKKTRKTDWKIKRVNDIYQRQYQQSPRYYWEY